VEHEMIEREKALEAAIRRVLEPARGGGDIEPWVRDILSDALAMPATVGGADLVVPGDMEPHTDVDKTIAIIRRSYGWALTEDGYVLGLVAGDMGFACTHIQIPPEWNAALAMPATTQGDDFLRGWEAGRDAAADALQAWANELWPDGNRTELADAIRNLTPPEDKP